MQWGIDVVECARIWKSGLSTIRSAVLDKVQNSFEKKSDLKNIMIDPGKIFMVIPKCQFLFILNDFPAISGDLGRRQNSWRRIVTLCVASGYAAPCLTASLSYYDSYRRGRTSSNLIQVLI